MESPALFIITGPVNSGKTTYLLDLLGELESSGLRPAGFVSERPQEMDAVCDYTIRDLMSGRAEPFSSRTPVEGWTGIRHFYFNPEALALGKKILASAKNAGTGPVVIDEVGPFELTGEVWSGSIERLLTPPVPSMIWVVRESILDDVIRKWELADAVIIRPGEISISGAVKKILSKLDITG
jgi:nucleoside-triphosphatase THEP1